MTKLDYGTAPIKDILIKVAFPSIISMLFLSLNIISDGIFTGNFIGSDALAALNLVTPIILISFLLGDLVATGSSVRISVLLGSGETQKANEVFSASLLIIMIISFSITFLGIFFAKDLIYYFIEDEKLAKLAYDYAKVFTYFFPLSIPLYALDNYLIVCRRAKVAMWINISTTFLNIGLNLYFIWYLRLGIEYVALATAISTSLGSLASVMPFIFNKMQLKFTKPIISLRQFKMIFYNGSSEFLGDVSTYAMMIIMNIFLLSVGGAKAVTAFAVVGYIDMVFIPILIGIVESLQPAVSYNYGMKNYVRIISLYKVLNIITFILSLFIIAFLLIFADFIIGIFLANVNEDVLILAKTALYIYAVSYLFSWYNIVVSTFLTACEKPKESIIVMVFESIGFPLFFIVILSSYYGLHGILLSQTVSAGVAVILGYVMWRVVAKQQKFI